MNALHFHSGTVIELHICSLNCRRCRCANASVQVMSCDAADLSGPEADSWVACAQAGTCTYTAFVQETCIASNQLACTQANITGGEAESRTACGDAGTCIYTAFEPRVTEACFATHITSCAEANISSPDNGVSGDICRSAGVCTYTPYVAPVAESCDATVATQCAAADLSSGDWRTQSYFCRWATGTDGDCTFFPADSSVGD